MGHLGMSSIAARLLLSVLTLRSLSLCTIVLSRGSLPGFRRDVRLEPGPAAPRNPDRLRSIMTPRLTGCHQNNT